MTPVGMSWATGGFSWAEEMPREAQGTETLRTSSHVSCPITGTPTSHTRKSSGECGSRVFVMFPDDEPR